MVTSGSQLVVVDGVGGVLAVKSGLALPDASSASPDHLDATATAYRGRLSPWLP